MLATGQKVLVICPVHLSNSDHISYFERMLTSVERQSERPLCVIVDDGSKIDVGGILKRFDSAIFRYVRREKSPKDLRTSSNAMNVGFDQLFEKKSMLTEKERSEVCALAFVHSDDYLPEGSLDIRLKELDESKGFVWGDRLYVNSRNEVVNFYKTGFYASNPLDDMFGFPNHSIMWSRSFLEKLKTHRAEHHGAENIFDENVTGFEDLDVTLASFQLARSMNLTPTYTGYVDYIYTNHEDTISGTLSSKNQDKYRKVLMDRYSNAGTGFRYYWNQLTADLPWSLFHHLPEWFKKPFRKRVNEQKLKKTVSIEEKRKWIWKTIADEQRGKLRQEIDWFTNRIV